MRWQAKRDTALAGKQPRCHSQSAVAAALCRRTPKRVPAGFVSGAAAHCLWLLLPVGRLVVSAHAAAKTLDRQYTTALVNTFTFTLAGSATSLPPPQQQPLALATSFRPSAEYTSTSRPLISRPEVKCCCSHCPGHSAIALAESHGWRNCGRRSAAAGTAARRSPRVRAGRTARSLRKPVQPRSFATHETESRQAEETRLSGRNQRHTLGGRGAETGQQVDPGTGGGIFARAMVKVYGGQPQRNHWRLTQISCSTWPRGKISCATSWRNSPVAATTSWCRPRCWPNCEVLAESGRAPQCHFAAVALEKLAGWACQPFGLSATGLAIAASLR